MDYTRDDIGRLLGDIFDKILFSLQISIFG